MLIKALFFPQKCLVCGKFSTNTLCDTCLSEAKFVYTPFCPVCQKPSIEGQPHFSCKGRFTPLMLITPYFFTASVKSAIKLSKYSKKAFVLTNYLVKYTLDYKEQFNYNLLQGFRLCAVPSDPVRLKKRGFNLPNVICDSLAKNLNLQQDHILLKPKPSDPLYKLSKKKRAEVVKGEFKVKSGVKIPANVCLVDDIFTTGATMNEACKTLKKAGVQNIICFALSYQSLNKLDS